MAEMSVEFSFDDEKLQENDKRKSDLYDMLKLNFLERGLACTADGEDVLIFSGTGKKSDYGRIWALIMQCTDHDGIVDYLKRFVFIEDNVVSDILAGIPRAKEIEAYGFGGISAKYA